MCYSKFSEREYIAISLLQKPRGRSPLGFLRLFCEVAYTVLELHIVYTYSIESLDLCDIIISSEKKTIRFHYKRPSGGRLWVFLFRLCEVAYASG